MEKSFIDITIKKYLEEQFSCNLSELEQDSNIFTINTLSKSPYIKIIAFNKCVIINNRRFLGIYCTFFVIFLYAIGVFCVFFLNTL